MANGPAADGGLTSPRRPRSSCHDIAAARSLDLPWVPPPHALELFAREAAPEAPAAVLLGSGDECGAQAFIEAPTAVLAVSGTKALVHRPESNQLLEMASAVWTSS